MSANVSASGVTDKNGQLFTERQEIRAALAIARQGGLDENIQVNGYTFIVDLTGFGTKHLTHLSIEDRRNWFNCWQV